MMKKKKYSGLVVYAVEMTSSSDFCEILAASVHEKATVRSVGQEVVTIDNYSSSGEFDTTWEKLDF